MANKTRAELKNLWVTNAVMVESSAPGAAAFDDVWDSHFNLGDDGLQEVYEKTGGAGGTLVLSATYGELSVTGDQNISFANTNGGTIETTLELDPNTQERVYIRAEDTSVPSQSEVQITTSAEILIQTNNPVGTAQVELLQNEVNVSASNRTKVEGTTDLDLVSNNPVEVKDPGGAAQRIKGDTPVDPDDLATKDYVDSTILPGTGDVVTEAPPGSNATRIAVYSNLTADEFHIRETPATVDPTTGLLQTPGNIESTAGDIIATAGNLEIVNVEATQNVTVGNNLDLSATDTIVSSAGAIDITTLPSHIADTANPHATSIANIGSGTRAELEAAVSDVTAFVASGDTAGGDLSGTYPDPQVSGITAAGPTTYTFGTISAGQYLYANGSGEIVSLAAVSGPPSGSAGGDLGGTYPSPEVNDLTIAGEQQGSVIYFNGVNWVELSPGAAGQVLQTGGVGANPSWVASAAGGDVSYGAGTVTTTELAVFNSVGTEIINSTEPLVVDLVTGAINNVEIIDGHIKLFDNTGSEPGYEEGMIYYANGAFNAYIDEADITLQIGQEFWIRVRNTSGAIIDNGAVVYISGASTPGPGDDLPTIELADASSSASDSQRRVLGVATHAISNNSNGYVTTAGTVRGLVGGANTKDITAFPDGQQVFLDPASPGDLTSTKPDAPDYQVVIGNVLDASAGNLLVQTTESISTNDIGGDGGFNVGNVKALADGDILSYNLANQRFENIVPSGGGGGGSVFTGNTYYVDSVYGNDGTAAPEDASKPFLTIGGAISGDGGRVAALAAGDKITVSPGIYAENSLSLPDNTALVSTGGWGQTIIGDTAAVNDILSIGQDCYVNGFTFKVPAGGNTAIDCNNTGGTNGIYNVNLEGDGLTGTGVGIYRSSGGKTIGGNIRVELGGIGSCFKVDEGVLALDGCHVPQSNGDITNVGYVTTKAGPKAGRGQFVGFNVGNNNVENAINIDGGTGTTLFTDKPFVIVYTPNIFNCDYAVTADSKYLEVNLIGGRIDNITNAVINLTDLTPSQAEAEAAIYRITSNHVPQYIFGTNSAIYSDFSLTFTQEATSTLDSQFNVFGATKFSVGFPERPTQSHLGHGAPYTTGMVVLTAENATGGTPDGVNFANVSTAAASKTGSTFSFPSAVASSANDVIYFGSLRQDISGPVKHWGLQLTTEVGETGVTRGEYIWEIWDGSSSWVEVGVQATSAREGYSYGSDVFWRSDSQEIIRYGIDGNTTWGQKTIDGTNAYWVRVRVVTPPSGGTPALPTFQTSKLADSSFCVSPSGVPYGTGLGMLRKVITLNGNIWTGDGNLADYSETIGATNSWTHKIKDAVMDGVGKAVMIQFPIPLGTCTAFPLRMFLEYKIINAPAGNISTPTSELDVYSLPIQVSGNNVADPAGGLVPTKRTSAATATVTANDAQLISNLELLPEGANNGDAFSTVEDRIHSILLCEVDISDYYEEDLVAIRFEIASLDGTSDIAVWSLVAEGVSHKDGKGIGI